VTAGAPRPLSRLALAAVAALQLATLPGHWIVTDQGEALLSARRLLDAGTLTLADAGVAAVPEAPWAPVERGEPVRSRLLPGTTLLLAPLLALDRALGLDRAREFGVLVHAQGALCLLAALAFASAGLRRSGFADAPAACALAALGLAWPAWMVAHRSGPEPALLALGCAVVAAAPAGSAGRWPRALALAAMPWFNPSGSVLAAGLAGGAWLAAGGGVVARTRATGVELAAVGLGQALVMAAWNAGYHGHWLEGGYHLVEGRASFGVVPLHEGLARHAGALLAQAPALVLLAGLGLRSVPAAAVSAALVLSAHLLFFATYEFQEPARRLAPALAALLPAAAAGAAALSPRGRAAAVALALVAGVHHFFAVEGRSLAGPHGLFYPSVAWVEWWIAGGPGLPLLAATLLASVALLAALIARVGRPS
jgi:hypothetical protein